MKSLKKTLTFYIFALFDLVCFTDPKIYHRNRPVVSTFLLVSSQANNRHFLKVWVCVQKRRRAFVHRGVTSRALEGTSCLGRRNSKMTPANLSSAVRSPPCKVGVTIGQPPALTPRRPRLPSCCTQKKKKTPCDLGFVQTSRTLLPFVEIQRARRMCDYATP